MARKRQANPGLGCCLGWYPTAGLVISFFGVLVWASRLDQWRGEHLVQANNVGQKQVLREAVLPQHTQQPPQQLAPLAPVQQQLRMQPGNQADQNAGVPPAGNLRSGQALQKAGATDLETSRGPAVSTQQQTVASTGKPPVLVYNRLSKTGGTVLERVLRKGIPGIIVVNEATTLLAGLGQVSQTQPLFVVGSIRDPCSMLLSHWSMVSEELLKLRCEDTEHLSIIGKRFCPAAVEHCVSREYCGVDQENGFLGDAERFRSWVRLPKIRSLASKRLARKWNHVAAEALKKNWDNNDAVASFALDRNPDCWLETDYIFDQLPACLQKFEARGGVVDWPILNADIELIKQRHAVNTGVYKKSSNVCERFFDNSTVEYIRNHDAAYFAVVKYSGCCTTERSDVS